MNLLQLLTTVDPDTLRNALRQYVDMEEDSLQLFKRHPDIYALLLQGEYVVTRKAKAA